MLNIPPREAWSLALYALTSVESSRLDERAALSEAVDRSGVKDYKARALARTLLVETLKRQNLVDHIVDSVLKPRSLNALKPEVRAFLRLYAYFTVFVVDGNLEAATRVAAIGRRIIGWKLLLPVEEALGEILSFEVDNYLKSLDDQLRIALKTYNPLWLVRYVYRNFSRGSALNILKMNEFTPTTFAFLNPLRGEEEEAIRRMALDGIKLERVEGLRWTHEVVGTRIPVHESGAYREGCFSVLDLSDSLALQAVGAEAGDRILVVSSRHPCKTVCLAQTAMDKGAVLCVSRSADWISALKTHTARTGISVIESLQADADSLSSITFRADKVVLDPPDTRTGSFWRLRSRKWRMKENSINRLSNLQFTMLLECAEHVKEGGSLTYSTHSLLLEENERLVERFLRVRPDFRLEDLGFPSMGRPALRGHVKCRRLYPHLHRTDGAFIAKLILD